jgi:hypothetical protein
LNPILPVWKRPNAAWESSFIAYVFSAGLDVLIAQVFIGATGFILLWLRWWEAKRLQNEQPPIVTTEDQPQI